ncbi:MAG: ABC transporter substrate-binding protein [Variibacter sp.]
MLNRRTFIASACAAACAAPRIARASGPFVLWGPPAAPSIVLSQAVAGGFLKSVAPDAAFKVWKSPDEMRAGLSSGTMTAVIVPTYVAANLYNRGLGVRLVNVMTDGLLYIVAAAGSVASIAELKGKRLAVPFRNDMPDFILRRLLTAARLKAGDLTIDYSGTPPEAAQMLIAGRVDAALLSEPSSTALIARAAAAGKTLDRVIDCQKAWAVAEGHATIPQAGLAVSTKVAEQIGRDGVAALQQGLENAMRAVLANPAQAAVASAGALELPAPIVERSIAFSHLVARPASAARADLTAFFDVLATEDARIIGGKQPDERFYAL